jgi:hypothetical protein
VNRRLRWLLAAALIAAGAVAGCGGSGSSAACGSDESVVSSPSPVFGSIAGSDDPRLKRLARAAAGWGLGTVVGGVGYDYDQWLTLGAVPAGLAAWTKRDPVISFVGDDLRPRWGLRQAAVSHAWSADADSFLQLELSKKHPLWLSSYGIDDGHRQWCATIGGRPTRQQDPYGTALVGGRSLVVLANGAKGSELTSLDTDSGRAAWTAGVTGIDRGDFLGDLGDGAVLVGGRAAYELGDARVPAPEGPSLAAVDEATGAVRWRYGSGEVHVVGRAGGLVVIEEVGSRQARPTGKARPAVDLVGLSAAGTVRWRRSAAKLGSDLATAGDTVVANTGTAFVGIDARTGRRIWSRSYPKVPQFLPYGFVLAAQPMLDAHHLLVGGTTGLHSLDVRTGAMHTYALPRDGINTTYWPYQVVLTSQFLAVVTNTGTVVIRRDGA